VEYFVRYTSDRLGVLSAILSTLIAGLILYSIVGKAEHRDTDKRDASCSASASRVVAEHARCLVRTEATLAPMARKQHVRRCDEKFAKAKQNWDVDPGVVCGATAVFDTAWSQVRGGLSRVRRVLDVSVD
jgi:hypothetical protein